MAKETYSYGKRELWQNRPTDTDLPKCQKRPIPMAEETYIYGKTDLFLWQNRPTDTDLPEACVSVKRDLFLWQKRPIHMAKEAY